MARRRKSAQPQEEMTPVPQVIGPGGDVQLQIDVQLPNSPVVELGHASPSTQSQEPTMQEYRQDTGEGLPSTSDRVPLHTDQDAQEKIRQRTEETVAFYAARLDQISERLDELEREWDTERTLETSFASVTFLGAVLALLSRRKWLVLPIAAGGFMLQHALQGWCPPLSLIRRMGVRTQREIDEERFALKALRGDFREIKFEEGDCVSKAQQALQAAHINGQRF